MATPGATPGKTRAGILSVAAVFSLFLQARVFAAGVAGVVCEIWTDPQGIPHARVSEEADLKPAQAAFACMGYLHGRDRAWQMDFFRRIAQGRKAEVLGADELRGDFTMRLIGLAERAAALYRSMSAQDRLSLEAYAYGANRGISEALKRGVYEFEQLGYQPEPWRPEDSLSVLLLQSFDQTRRTFEHQISQSEWEARYGRNAQLWSTQVGTPWYTTILKEGEYAKREKGGNESFAAPIPSTVAASLKEMQKGFGAHLGAGSNSWVLAPSHSSTGHAWLANDPHLDLKYPPFWYWLNIETGNGEPGSLNAIGASLPGFPVIASGTNLGLSWGLTNSYFKVARVSHVPTADLKNSTIHLPLIWVKVGPFRLPFFFKAFERTAEDWPVLPLEAPKGHKMVLQWTGFDLKANDLIGLPDLMMARNAREADEKLSTVGVPSWNYVFADREGEIGYRVVGRAPRAEDPFPFGVPQQRLREMAQDPAFTNSLSPEDMPHVMNPPRGWIVTANNPQWSEDSRFQAGDDHAPSFRAFRIEELLKATSKHDLGSIQKVQCDVQAVDARFLLPVLLNRLKSDASWHPLPEHLEALKMLRGWNFEADLKNRASGIYRRWVDELKDQTFDDEAGLFRALQNTGIPQSALRQTFETAADEAQGEWGKIHLNFFPHLAGDDRFEAPPIGTPGDDYSVNPGTSHWEEDNFSQTAGASQRLVVEMTSPPQVYSVLPGTNVDLEKRDPREPGSAWQLWLNCQLQKRIFPVNWTEIEKEKPPTLAKVRLGS